MAIDAAAASLEAESIKLDLHVLRYPSNLRHNLLSVQVKLSMKDSITRLRFQFFIVSCCCC